MAIAEKYLKECASKRAEPYYGFIKASHEGIIDCDLDFVPAEDVRRMAYAMSVVGGGDENGGGGGLKRVSSKNTGNLNTTAASGKTTSSSLKLLKVGNAATASPRTASPSPTFSAGAIAVSPLTESSVGSGGLASAQIPLRIIRFARGVHRDRQHPPVRSNTMESYRKLLQTYGEKSNEGGGGKSPSTSGTAAAGGSSTSGLSEGVGAYSIPTFRRGISLKIATGIASCFKLYAATLLELHLVNIDLDAAGAKKLADSFTAAAIVTTPALRVLNLSNNPRLEDSGATAICAALGGLECLVRLELSKCSLTNNALRAVAAVFSANRDKCQGRVWKGSLRGGGGGGADSAAGNGLIVKTAIKYIDLSGNYLGGGGSGGGGGGGTTVINVPPTNNASLTSAAGYGNNNTTMMMGSPTYSTNSGFGASLRSESLAGTFNSNGASSVNMSEFSKELLNYLRNDDSLSTLILRDNLFSLKEIIAFADFFSSGGGAGEQLEELDFTGCSGLEHCDDLAPFVGGCDLSDDPSRNGGIVARRGLLLKTTRGGGGSRGGSSKGVNGSGGKARIGAGTTTVPTAVPSSGGNRRRVDPSVGDEYGSSPATGGFYGIPSGSPSPMNAAGMVAIPPPPPPPPPANASRQQIADWAALAQQHHHAYVASIAAQQQAQQATQQALQMQQIIQQQQQLMLMMGGGAVGPSMGMGFPVNAMMQQQQYATASAAAGGKSVMFAANTAGGGRGGADQSFLVPPSQMLSSSNLNGTVVVSPCTPAYDERKRQQRTAAIHLGGELEGGGDVNTSGLFGNTITSSSGDMLGNTFGARAASTLAPHTAAGATGGGGGADSNAALVDNRNGPIGLQELLLLQEDEGDNLAELAAAGGAPTAADVVDGDATAAASDVLGKHQQLQSEYQQLYRAVLSKMEIDDEHKSMQIEQLRHMMVGQQDIIDSLQEQLDGSQKKLETANKENAQKILQLSKAQVNQQMAMENRPAPQVILKEIPRTDQEVLMSHLGTEFAMLIGQGIRKIEKQIQPTPAAGGTATSTSGALLSSNSNRMPLSSGGLGSTLSGGSAAAAAAAKKPSFEEDVANRLSQLGW